MKCDHCNKEIPDGSEYCSYCGSKQEERTYCHKCGNLILTDSEFCQYCGAPLQHSIPSNFDKIRKDFSNDQYSSSSAAPNKGPSVTKSPSILPDRVGSLAPTIKKPEKKNSLLKPVFTILLVVVIVLAGLNIYQFFRTKTIISNYDTVVSAIHNNNYGYAADYFHVDQGIIVLEAGESKELLLTAAFGGPVRVDTVVDYYDIASVMFNEPNWEGDNTTITVKSQKGTSGMARITFTNSVDSSSFQVLVIVE